MIFVCTSKRRCSSAFSDWRFCSAACSSPSLDWETWRQFLRNRSTSSNRPKKKKQSPNSPETACINHEKLEIYYWFYHATSRSPISKSSTIHSTKLNDSATPSTQGVPGQSFHKRPSNESISQIWDRMGQHRGQHYQPPRNGDLPSTNQTWRFLIRKSVYTCLYSIHLGFSICFYMLFICVSWIFLLPWHHDHHRYPIVASKSWIFPCAASSSSSKRLWTSRAFWSSEKAWKMSIAWYGLMLCIRAE